VYSLHTAQEKGQKQVGIELDTMRPLTSPCLHTSIHTHTHTHVLPFTVTLTCHFIYVEAEKVRYF